MMPPGIARVHCLARLRPRSGRLAVPLATLLLTPLVALLALLGVCPLGVSFLVVGPWFPGGVVAPSFGNPLAIRLPVAPGPLSVGVASVA